ncbi:MAG: SWIM zinc finger family protein [Cyanobacteria bacterium HKST-UBA02]|nr:SWIM zinc finger family protein [Cyanobacteria bacterium HKST-UBA02]
MPQCSYSRDQVLALAPDDSSRKAGEGLSTTRKWSNLGSDGRSLWGECQGSGSRPYQTCVDLGEPAFKCSCPSRKFPCKHGLGLFLLFAADSGAVAEGEPPDWVLAWIGKRLESQQKKEQKARDAAEKPVDAEAQARRQAKRQANIEDGLAELDRWLCDRIRHGLSRVQTESYEFWDGIAARMVDAQAPGLARMLRQCASISSSGENWQERLLERLSLIHLAVGACSRIESLSPEMQTELKSVLGVTVSREEVLARAREGIDTITDRWQVMGQFVEQEERLRVKRSWLYGTETGKWALVLNFAHGTQPLDVSLVPGFSFAGELAYFPGVFPLRALVKGRDSDNSSRAEKTPVVHDDYSGALADYARALSRNPWLESYPFAISNVVPVLEGESVSFIDRQSNLLRARLGRRDRWRLLSVSGGGPVDIFGEWDGDSLMPLSVTSGKSFLSLEAEGA